MWIQELTLFCCLLDIMKKFLLFFFKSVGAVHLYLRDMVTTHCHAY